MAARILLRSRFYSKNHNFEPFIAKEEVLNDYPHSQHRPVLITSGFRLPNFRSTLYHFGTFRKQFGLSMQRTLNLFTNKSLQRRKNFLRFNKLMQKVPKKHIKIELCTLQLRKNRLNT